MNRIAYIEPIGGIAGDMVLAALVELGADLDAINGSLRDLGVPGINVSASSVMRGPFSATHIEVHASADEQTHRQWLDIRKLLAESTLSERSKAQSLKVFERIAEAEAAVHGIPVDDVHFHEVGAWDSIADIVGVVIALEQLEIDRIVASAPPLSSGTIRSAHGVMPLPAPATLRLLEGWPVRPGPENMESTTPTGAGILSALTENGPLPAMRVLRSGYGAGTRDRGELPNVVRVTIGEPSISPSVDAVLVIEAQMDDLAGEHLPPLIDALLSSGALDAYATPVLMKKGRPGLLVSALAYADKEAAVSEAMLRHGSTFGVRVYAAHRRTLERWHDTVETPWGAARVKVGALDGEILHAAPEYEDVLSLAKASGQPAPVIHAAASHGWRNTKG